MDKNLPGEQWRKVQFDFEFTNDFILEISNLGRLRSFNKVSNGNIIMGTMINGYRIIRLKFYTQRKERTLKKFDFLQEQVIKLSKKIRLQNVNAESKTIIHENVTMLNSLKKNLSKKFKEDLKERTINYQSLIHRLVAFYFLPKPSAIQTVVAHLDYDKLNNKATNLKWMTKQENYIHQRNSPYVIEEKQVRKTRRKEDSKATKLTVTKVMLLKKLLNENKPMKHLVKHFKITDTQILRIKRNENWADIPAAT